MFYKIKCKLCFTAIALILTASANQKVFAVQPLAAPSNNTNANGVVLIPDEISLGDEANENALLTPPTLDDVAPIPLDAKNSLNPSSNDADVIPLSAPLLPQVENNKAENKETSNSAEGKDAAGKQNLALPPLENKGASDLKLPALKENAKLPLPIQNNNTASSGEKNNLAPNGVKEGGNPLKPLSKVNSPLAANEEKSVENVQPMKPLKPQSTSPQSSNFGEAILSQIDNDLFNQMSDLEKQTSLLTLELRREKVKNEIAAIKAARQKSIDEANELKEEKERKKAEWELEQKRKLLIEEQKLKELNIAYEKLRQETILKAYKEEMLATNQNWIDNNAKLYGEIIKMEEERDNLVNNYRLKLNYLAQLSAKASEAAENAKKNYGRELANLQTQVSILKSRLEAEKKAREQISVEGGDKANPFAALSEGGDNNKEKSQKLSDEYAVMEIRGQGSELTAKIINKLGASFVVQKGTILQTGHMVDEISQTYVKATKDGNSEYLYFAAGGVLDREPVRVSIPAFPANMTPLPQKGSSGALPSLSSNQGLPSLKTGMFVR